MKDQVDKLAHLGVLAASVNDISEENTQSKTACVYCSTGIEM